MTSQPKEGKVFFTSDTHWGHDKVLTYCPMRKSIWPDVRAMNQGLVDRWNEIVSPGDTVYHLGDWSMGPKRIVEDTLRLLNGTIVLVRGNHDRSVNSLKASGFKEVYPELKAKFYDEDGNPHNVFLKHKPPAANLDWQKDTGCDWYIHGHVHQHHKRFGNTINAGVDVWDYRPVSFQQLITAPDELICYDPYVFEDM